MALINVAGMPRRPDDDPLTAMFQTMPKSAQLPQAGPPAPSLAPPTATDTTDPFKARPGENLPSAAPQPQPGENPPPAVPPPAPPAAPAPTPSTAPFTFDQIDALYQQYLGRAASQAEYQGWATGAYGPPNLPSIQQQIQNSQEAQAWRTAHAPPPPTNTTGNRKDRNYIASVVDDWFQNQNIQGHQDKNLWIDYMLNSGGLGPDNMEYWLGRFREARGTHQEGSSPAPAPSSYPGTNIFDDPATAQFEQLLNSLINRFNTPQTPPHYQQAIDQLNAYLAKLNGPVYSPAEMELMQTQVWDPMMQQKDAARLRLTERLGSRGVTPGSGVYESAMEDLDRQFQQAHTQQQAGFTNQAIGLQRQNWATAATLAPQISALEQAQTSWQDQRALQGEMLAALIPQMASQRLRDASGSIQGLNPTSLLSMLQGFQQQGYGQGANYGNTIMQILSQLFGMGG